MTQDNTNSVVGVDLIEVTQDIVHCCVENATLPFKVPYPMNSCSGDGNALPPEFKLKTLAVQESCSGKRNDVCPSRPFPVICSPVHCTATGKCIFVSAA